MSKILSILANKRGSSAGGAIDKMVGALIVVVLLGAVASLMFSTNWTEAGAPAWFGVAVPAVIGIGLFVLILAVFGLYKYGSKR